MTSSAGAGILFGLLAEAFAPLDPIVLALDDMIERRRGRRTRTQVI